MTDKPKLVEVENIHALPTYMEQCRLNCVEILEEFLQMAKDGRITQVAVTFSTSDGYTGERLSMMHDQMRILAAITMMQQTMAMRIRRSDKPMSELDNEDDPA